MTFDMNDAEPQKTGELIPDGTFAKLTMVIRPGGVDGDEEVDRGLLKRSATPGSDVLMLDCEFTVAEGPHVRRKFWQTLTVQGGKVDENGVSIGAKITKSTLRAMIESALGLDPDDQTKTPRRSAWCAALPISRASPSSARSGSRSRQPRLPRAEPARPRCCRTSPSGGR